MSKKVKKYSGATVTIKGYIGYGPEDRGNWSTFTIYDRYEGREGEEVTARYQVSCFKGAHDACVRFAKNDYVEVVGGQYPRAYIDKDGNAQVANSIKVFDEDGIRVPEFQSARPNYGNSKPANNGQQNRGRNEPPPFEDDDIPF